MTSPSTLDWIIGIATPAAAGAAAWAAWETRRSARKTAELVAIESERWHAEREVRKRADVVVWVDRRRDANAVVVTNRGPAAAYDVNLDLDISATADKVAGLAETFPVSLLPPHQSVRLGLRVIPQSGRRYRGTLSWTDDARQHRHEQDVLRNLTQ